MTLYLWWPGGESCTCRKFSGQRSTLKGQDRAIVYHVSDQRWNCFKSNIREMSERPSGIHVGGSECLDSILNWTELMLLWNFLFDMIIIIPFGKFGPPYLGKATAAARAAIPSPTSARWCFLCVSIIHQTDMDYMIFNVHTWSFLCVRINMGVGHTDSMSA